MKRSIIFLAILIAGPLLVQTRPIKVVATPNPLTFSLIALISGWNATTRPNPALTEFRGVSFTTKVVWGGDVPHIYAIYVNGTPSTSVVLGSCVSPCLAASAQVSSTRTTASLIFTPSVPPDDFIGVGGYEYYCQIHPDTMHGHIKIFKNPDFDPDHLVDIVDVAKVAFAYGSVCCTGRWNATLDLNNDAKLDILDVAVVAFYFGQPI